MQKPVNKATLLLGQRAGHLQSQWPQSARHLEQRSMVLRVYRSSRRFLLDPNWRRTTQAEALSQPPTEAGS